MGFLRLVAGVFASSVASTKELKGYQVNNLITEQRILPSSLENISEIGTCLKTNLVNRK